MTACRGDSQTGTTTDDTADTDPSGTEGEDSRSDPEIGTSPVDSTSATEPETTDDPRFELRAVSAYEDGSCGYHETIFRAQITAVSEPIEREQIVLRRYTVEGFMSDEDLQALPQPQAEDDMRFPLSVGESTEISFYRYEDAPPATCDGSDDEPGPSREVNAEFVIAGTPVEVNDSVVVWCGFSECED